MRHRAFLLREKTKDIVQRCDISQLSSELPKKDEYIVVVKLSEMQQKLYRTFLEAAAASEATAKLDVACLCKKLLIFSFRVSFFTAWHVLAKIWNHPRLLFHTTDPSKANQG